MIIHFGTVASLAVFMNALGIFKYSLVFRLVRKIRSEYNNALHHLGFPCLQLFQKSKILHTKKCIARWKCILGHVILLK